MTWEDRISDNDQKLLKEYQYMFDKNARKGFTPYMQYWQSKIIELQEEIKRRES